ncbi:SPW repeat protein [Streptomyces sp. CC228A]|uniref:SPW repeat protein n=1 Tax=Streptomyces sp. CC228A TaxID=2898186 RepID=UPI001F36C41A|nr:SPW repeat protein [Streptomyces sp. CC228A]
MAYSRQSADTGRHYEHAETRAPREETAARGTAAAAEGLLMLAGVYAAVSPWVVHFSGTEASLAVNNLIAGIAVALLGLCLALAPERMARVAWAAVPLGIWLIIAPWVATVDHGAGAGVIWNNVATGAAVCVFGMAAAGATVAVRRSAPR